MADVDREASEALLALGSAVTGSEHIEIDLSIDKENKDKIQERDHVIVKNKDKKDPLVECIYCDHLYFGGLPRIRAHLAQLPGRGIVPCHKVPQQVLKAFREKDQAIAEKAKKVQDAKDVRVQLASQSTNGVYLSFFISALITSSLVGESSHPSSSHGPLASLWIQKNSDNVDLDVAKFFYGNAISFNVIDSPYFKNMVASIAKHGTSYKPPGSTQLRTSLLEKTKNEVDSGLQVIYVCLLMCMHCPRSRLEIPTHLL